MEIIMHSWKDKKVLVTGAGGFIGSHLTEELVSLGAQVTCFVRYTSTENIGNLKYLSNEMRKEIKIINGNLEDQNSVRSACIGKDVVFHLGALIGVPYSFVHPQEVIRTNSIGTLNILHAAKEEKVSKLIITSTSEVYGSANYVPIDEKHPLQAQSPYAASKIAADKFAESYFKSYKLPVSIIRPFNTYGPRQTPRAVIPTIIMQCMIKDEVIVGTTTTTRDFTFVTDTIQGFIKVAESEKSIGEIINVGSNSEITIGDLIKKIASFIGRDVRIVTDQTRFRPNASEVLRLWADNTKAKEIIGWEPRYSLDQGLRITIEWLSQNLEELSPNKYYI